MLPSSIRTRQQHLPAASASSAPQLRGTTTGSRPTDPDSAQESDSAPPPQRSRSLALLLASPKTKVLLILGALLLLASLSLLSELTLHTLSHLRSRYEARWRDGHQPSQVHPPTFAWNSTEWEGHHARLLLAMEAGDYQGLHNVSRLRLGRDDDSTVDSKLAYHLVLTSCYRPHWGRYLATTLLQIWLQGAGPTTVTIMWCQPYNASATMPGLFFNLRHSTGMRLLHVPSEAASGIPVHPVSTYFWALMVPDYLQRPELPLFVMEDDVVMVPQFADKMRSALAWVLRMADRGSDCYMLNLYKPQGAIANASQMLDPKVYNAKSRKDFNRPYYADAASTASTPPPGSRPSWRSLRRPPHGSLIRGSRGWNYGVQGQLFSPALRSQLTRHFWEVQTGRYAVEGYQDMILHDYMFERRGTGLRELWGVRPSMMQHTGAASGVFGGVSMRYHMAPEFPFHVQVPFFDDNLAW